MREQAGRRRGGEGEGEGGGKPVHRLVYRLHLYNLDFIVVQETEEERQEQKRVRSTYSVRRSSIMSIVYGKNDLLDESLHKTMYDVPVVTCSQATQSGKSSDDASVLQIKEVDSLGQNQANQNWIRASARTSRATKSEKSFISPKSEEKPKKESIHSKRFKRFRRLVKKVVSSKYFESFIVFCILLNTLFMAIEYHGMDPVLQHVVLIANIVSTLPSLDSSKTNF